MWRGGRHAEEKAPERSPMETDSLGLSKSNFICSIVGNESSFTLEFIEHLYCAFVGAWNGSHLNAKQFRERSANRSSYPRHLLHAQSWLFW